MSNIIKVIADSDIPFLRGVLEPYVQITYLKGKEINAEAVRDADALIIRTRTRCDASLLGNSRVRF
ncbi:MAG: phosphoglycerate dehydrogenase-like oxidoreductase, partial [Bacteroidetes bacterium]|nr:phosphoglycerate dehydrogenase-like oxidoreductase [Bacteroidota bacterium]